MVAVSLDADWRPGGAGKPPPFGCRRLLVVHPRNIDDVFEDDPLAARQAAAASAALAAPATGPQGDLPAGGSGGQRVEPAREGPPTAPAGEGA